MLVGEKWFQLNKAQQEAHLRKVHTQKLQFNLGLPVSGYISATTSTSSDDRRLFSDPSASNIGSNSPVSSIDSASDVRPDSPVPVLGVNSGESASRVQLPHTTVQAIWHKAEVLLKMKGSIVPTPGMQNSWYVESKSKQVPHLVRVSPKGIISCDKVCEHYCSIKICSHAVAIAQKTDSLVAFANDFVKKKGKHSPNLGNFALTGMPAGRNKKGAIPPRKRLPKTGSSLLPHSPLGESSSSDSAHSVSPGHGTSVPLQKEGQERVESSYRYYGSPFQTNSGESVYHPPYCSPLFYQPNYGSSSYQQCFATGAYPYLPTSSPSTPSMQTFPSSSTPMSAADSNTGNPFVLKFLNHMLKVCAGCRSGYFKKPDGSLPDPPYDLCVWQETVITLTNPVNKSPFQKKISMPPQHVFFSNAQHSTL